MYNVPPVNLSHFNTTKLSTRTRAQRSEKILRPALAGQAMLNTGNKTPKLAPSTAEFPEEPASRLPFLPLLQKLSLPFSTSRSAADTQFSLPAGDQAPSSTARGAGEKLFPGSALSYKGCILSDSTKGACSDWSSLSQSLSGTLPFPRQTVEFSTEGLSGSQWVQSWGVGVGGSAAPEHLGTC